MVTYEITAPDGSTYEVTAPEDATEQQVMAYAQQNFAQLQQKQQAAQPVSTGTKVARGVMDTIEGPAQLLYNVLPDSVAQAGNQFNNWLADKGVPVGRVPQGGLNEMVRQNEAGYQAQRAAAGESGFDGMRLAGNVMSPANLSLASKAMKLAPAVNRLVRPLQVTSQLPGKVLSGAAGGAAQGTMMPVTHGDFWDEKAKQAAVGAAVGGALPVVGKFVPKRTAEAKELMARGVKVPFLQQFGQGAGRFEDKLQSLPLVGDAIRSNRIAARDQFNRATWDKVLEPLGQKLPPNVAAGNKAAQIAQGQISKSYDAILPKIGFSADQQFNAEIANLRKMASSLPAEQQQQFERILKTEVFDRMTPAGLMSGEAIKRAESRLGQKMRTAMRSQNVWDGDMADALHEAQAVIRSTLERQNPKFAPQLQAINKAQAMAYRPERASAALGAKDGVFSPAQLLNAVKATDPTKNKRAFAQGRSLMQDWAQTADNTLSSQIPDSGTAERLLMNAGALGGLAVTPTFGQVAAGAAMLPYLPFGGRMLGRGVANVLDETANAFTNRAPYAALPFTPATYGLLYGGQNQ